MGVRSFTEGIQWGFGDLHQVLLKRKSRPAGPLLTSFNEKTKRFHTEPSLSRGMMASIKEIISGGIDGLMHTLCERFKERKIGCHIKLLFHHEVVAIAAKDNVSPLEVVQKNVESLFKNEFGIEKMNPNDKVCVYRDILCYNTPCGDEIVWIDAAYLPKGLWFIPRKNNKGKYHHFRTAIIADICENCWLDAKKLAVVKYTSGLMSVGDKSNVLSAPMTLPLASKTIKYIRRQVSDIYMRVDKFERILMDKERSALDWMTECCFFGLSAVKDRKYQIIMCNVAVYEEKLEERKKRRALQELAEVNWTTLWDSEKKHIQDSLSADQVACEPVSHYLEAGDILSVSSEFTEPQEHGDPHEVAKTGYKRRRHYDAEAISSCEFDDAYEDDFLCKRKKVM